VKDERAKFVGQMGELDAMTLHFIDECGVHDAMVPICGWARRGQRARGSKPRSRGRHLTVVGGVSLREGFYPQHWPGPMKGQDFASWVEGCLVPRLRPGDTVIMDRCRIHFHPDVVRLIEAAGAQVLYLPPYSPDFNPIEEAWSKFKTNLRRMRPENAERLCESVAVAAKQVTDENIKGWVRHAGYAVST